MLAVLAIAVLATTLLVVAKLRRTQAALDLAIVIAEQALAHDATAADLMQGDGYLDEDEAQEERDWIAARRRELDWIAGRSPRPREGKERAP